MYKPCYEDSDNVVTDRDNVFTVQDNARLVSQQDFVPS